MNTAIQYDVKPKIYFLTRAMRHQGTETVLNRSKTLKDYTLFEEMENI